MLEGELEIAHAGLREAGKEIGDLLLIDLDVDGAVVVDPVGKPAQLGLLEDLIEAMRHAEAQAGRRDRRRQFVGAAARGDPAVIEEDHSVAKLRDFVHVVRREDDRDPLFVALTADERANQDGDVGVERSRRLVEQDHPGPGQECLGQHHAGHLAG